MQKIPSGTIYTTRSFNSSCPHLLRASTSCSPQESKTWMAGTSPAMTSSADSIKRFIRHAHLIPSCPHLLRASTSFSLQESKTWMAGTSPAMTSRSDQKKPYEIIVMNVTFPLTFVTITVTPQSSAIMHNSTSLSPIGGPCAMASGRGLGDGDSPIGGNPRRCSCLGRPKRACLCASYTRPS